MKDLLGYIERLDHSMTKQEKLFFLNKINVCKFDYIIDFGCANGRLLHEIDKHIGDRKCATQFIGVDNNPQIRIGYSYIRKFTRVSSLDEIGELNGKVLLILSSVLHELSTDTVSDVFHFVRDKVDTLAIRDMYFVRTPKAASRSYKILNWISANFSTKHLCMFNQIRDNAQKNRLWFEALPAEEVLHEFFLKYTYESNWESEVKECYFNQNAKWFIDRMLEGSKVLYRKRYILPYKREQILRDFGYKTRTKTHIKLIVKIKRKK